jgi:hypothetical protein
VPTDSRGTPQWLQANSALQQVSIPSFYICFPSLSFTIALLDATQSEIFTSLLSKCKKRLKAKVALRGF